MKPPAIRMFTPSGRFVTNTRLCLSISDFHPESWSPLWNIGTILTGLVSFMCDTTPTLGSIEASDARRRDLASRSLEFNKRDPLFQQIFPDVVEEFEKRYNPPQQAASSSSSSTTVASSTAASSTSDESAAAAAVAPVAAPVPAVVPPVVAVAAAPAVAKARPTARAGNGATPIADALTYIVLVFALLFAARFAGISIGWN
jgi:ubiquitin-conjugating enzyme E2 J2